MNKYVFLKRVCIFVLVYLVLQKHKVTRCQYQVDRQQKHRVTRCQYQVDKQQKHRVARCQYQVDR